jgi:hypothetical protein
VEHVRLARFRSTGISLILIIFKKEYISTAKLVNTARLNVIPETICLHNAVLIRCALLYAILNISNGHPCGLHMLFGSAW